MSEKLKDKVWVIHPYGLAVYPLLALYTHNRDQVELQEIGVYLLGAYFLAAVLKSFLQIVLKEPCRAGFITSYFFLAFFSFGHFYELFYDLKIHAGTWVFGPSAATYLLYFFLTLGVSFLVRKMSANFFRYITLFLNPFSTGLLLLCLLPLAGSAFLGGRFVRETPAGSVSSTLLTGTNSPDIYYLVLDAYSRQDRLQADLGFDNGPFLESLKAKGFFIDSQSRSNYAQTYLSLSSILNMEYLEKVAKEAGIESSSMRPLRNRIVRNKVFAALKNFGYQTVVFDSGYAGTEQMKVDRHVRFAQGLSEFQNEILNLTPIPSLVRFFGHNGGLQYERHRENTRYVFDHFAETVSLKSPKIIFTHILMPHPPFVFGENGEPITPAGIFSTGMPEMGRENIEKHNHQLRYLNRRVLEMVNVILAKSVTPPIIILQSDHGLKSRLDIHAPQHSDEELRNGFYNLGAYYFPGEGRKKLYDGMTPVNLFRVILSHYFQEPYPLLADKSLFSTSERPYAFDDVTQRITAAKSPMQN